MNGLPEYALNQLLEVGHVFSVSSAMERLGLIGAGGEYYPNHTWLRSRLMDSVGVRVTHNGLLRELSCFRDEDRRPLFHFIHCLPQADAAAGKEGEV